MSCQYRLIWLSSLWGRPAHCGIRRTLKFSPILISFQKHGPHIFENIPHGLFFEYHGHAIGTRSQAARTYLENNFEQYSKCTEAKDIALHCLKALAATLKNSKLTTSNTQLVVIGKEGAKFYYADELEQLLNDANPEPVDGLDDEEDDNDETTV